MILAGCSGADDSKIKMPKLGKVKGIVKLGGKPLEGATVEFNPGTARPSVGVTDANGSYTLKYDESNLGAAVGEHTVRITTKSPTSSPVEKVPARYNEKSEEKRSVKEGDNEFDFDLPEK